MIRNLVRRGGILCALLACSVLVADTPRGYTRSTTQQPSVLQAEQVAQQNDAILVRPGNVAIVAQQQPRIGGKKDAAVRLPNGPTLNLDLSKNISASFAAAGSNGTVIVPKNSTVIPPNVEQGTIRVSGGARVDRSIASLLEHQDSVDVIIQVRSEERQSVQQQAAVNDTIAASANISGPQLDLPLINGFAVSVHADELQRLESDKRIERIWYDAPAQVTLDSSLPDIHVPDVWPAIDASNQTMTGKGVRIAILDSGIDYHLPDFGGCFGVGCRVVGGYDFVNSDSDPMDDMGHGTHVAGTAAGKGQVGSTRIYGVAPDATLYAYKVCNSSGSCSSSAVVAALGYATDPNRDSNTADHVDVASLSLGGSGNPDDAMSLAVDAATAAGVVVTVAAGNSGPTASTIQSPGNARTAITVAAACKSGEVGGNSYCTQPIASFSSRGPYVYNSVDLQKPDVAAPGVNICAAQWGTAYATTASNCIDQHHIRLNGTSMATPHVAGVAALIKQANPSLTPAQVKSLLRSTATSLGVSANMQGAGEVNAAAAISATIKVTSSPSEWVISSDPTTRYTTVEQSFSVTSHDAGVGVVDIGIVNAPTGVSLTPSVATLDLSGNTTKTFTASITIDNNTAVTANVLPSITFTASGTTYGAIVVPITITPTISISDTQIIDYGVDSPDLSSWTSATHVVTVTNLRTDIAQTVTPEMSDFSVSTTANLPGATVIAAGGQASLNTSITNTNSGITNGLYYGRLTISTGVSSVNIATKFTKFYVVTITTTSGHTPMFTVHDITHSTLTISYSSPIYLAGSGPYDIMIDDTDGSNNKTHVIHEDITPSNGQVNITYNQTSDAPHRLRLTAKKINGATGVWSESIRTVVYPATDAVGYWTLTATPGQEFSTADEYYSTATSKYKYLTTFVAPDTGKPADWYLYDAPLLNGISGNVTYAYSPSDIHIGQVVLKSSAQVGTAHPGIYFANVGTWANLELYNPYATDVVNIFSTMPSGSDAYDGVYGVSTEELPSDCDGSSICPSAALSPLFTLESGGDQWLQLRPNHWNNRQLQFPLADATSGTHYNNLGPLMWFGKFNNTATRVKYGPYYGEFSPFLRQDFAMQHLAMPSYTVKNGGGTTVASGSIQPKIIGAYYNAVERYNQFYFQAGLTGFDQSAAITAGAYHFETSVNYSIAGQSCSASVDASFTTSLPDPNPPSITRMEYFANQQRTDQYVTGATNVVRLSYDAVGGTISSVAISYSTNGSSYTVASVTNADPVYSIELPNNLSGSMLWLKAVATDSSGNSLQYIWQQPFGVLPSSTDTTAPVVLLRSVTNNQTVTPAEALTVTADALDNVGVDHVDYLLDGAVVGTATTSPYSATLDMWDVTVGSHTLAARAYDVAGNSTTSWGMTIAKPLDEYAFDFSSGTDFNDWTAVNGAWSIANGVATAPTSATPVLNFYQIAPTNMKAQANIRFSGASQEAGIALRATDENNLYFCGAEGTSLKLYKRVSGAWTTIGQATISSIAMSTWYTMRAQAHGSAIQCAFWQANSAEPATWLLSKTDTTFTTGQTGIGVKSNGGVNAPDVDTVSFRHSSVGVAATPAIQFSASTGGQDESQSSVAIPLELSATSETDVTVGYSVTGGTATGSGTDYTLASGVATIPAGDLTTDIVLSVVDDALFETNETIVIALAGPSGATTGIRISYTYTIQDNDTAPTVAFITGSGSGSESVTSPSISLTQSAVSGKTTTVHYSVTGGTATGDGTDYTLASGTASISAGSTTTTVPLSIVNDQTYESSETITITLDNPSNATLGGTTSYTYTITDDDTALPTIGFAAATDSGNESVTPADITILASNASYQDMSVDVRLSGGTASVGTDILDPTTTITIPAGQTSATLHLSVIDDSEINSNVTVELTAENPVHAALGTSSMVYTIVNDDRLPTAASVLVTAPSTTKRLVNDRTSSVTFTATNSGETATGPVTLEIRIPRVSQLLNSGWKCTLTSTQRRCTKTVAALGATTTRQYTLQLLPGTGSATKKFTVEFYLRASGVTTIKKVVTWNLTRYYTVGSGESLQSISRNAYGTTASWKTIRTANIKAYPSLKQSTRLQRGWRLLLP